MLKELESILDMLETKHIEIKDLLIEIGDNSATLNWQPLGEDTLSIFALAADVALQEDYWISHVIGEGLEPIGIDQIQEAKGPKVAPLIGLLDAAFDHTRQTFEQLTPETLDGQIEFNADIFSTRWCLLNALQHAAENQGQISIMWQWWQQIQNSIN